MPRIGPDDTRPPLSGGALGSRTPAKPPLPLDERAAARRPERARPERLRTDRPTRWAVLRRRGRRLLRPLAWAAACLLFVGLVALLARSVQPGSAVAALRERAGAAVGLLVQQVVIEGRNSTPESQLRAALGVQTGDNLLGVSLDATRARIERLTWVQHATVERRLPGTIVVRLVERRPFAVWQNGGKFVLIDRAGQAVAEQDPVKDQAAFAVLPLVVGPGAPEAAAALMDLVAAQPALKGHVAAAVRVGERRWNLRLQNGTDVLLPEGQEAAALARLAELQSAQALLDRPLQVIDLRLPDRLVIRPLPEPRAPAAATPKRPT